MATAKIIPSMSITGPFVLTRKRASDGNEYQEGEKGHINSPSRRWREAIRVPDQTSYVHFHISHLSFIQDPIGSYLIPENHEHEAHSYHIPQCLLFQAVRLRNSVAVIVPHRSEGSTMQKGISNSIQKV